jgi:hypothetical protein
MNKKSRSRKFSAKQSARLGAYFAAGVGASMAATSADAAIVVVNVTPFAGPNAGAPLGGYTTFDDWAGPGTGTIYPSSNYTTSSGNIFTTIWPARGLEFAVNSNASFSAPPFSDYASPVNFASNTLIDGTALFTSYVEWTAFRMVTAFATTYPIGTTITSPDFGPNSFIGFRFANGDNYNYGWLEVTWDTAKDEFQILGAAYESEINVGIAAGAVPEPSTYALLALAAGGGAYLRWRRRRDAAQKEAA